MPSFEDYDMILETTTMAGCGETIQYAPPGGSASAKKAIVNYADAPLDTGNGIAIHQAMTVEIMKADVPDKPTAACRVTLAKRPDDLFQPVNVTSDSSGNCWTFELEKVFV